MKHYVDMICQFGALNGLCSSIMESKHIKAVKEPYWQSNHNEPLGQMLLTNQRLDKLASACSGFAAYGMLDSHILADICTNTKPQETSSEGKSLEIHAGLVANLLTTTLPTTQTIRAHPTKKTITLLRPMI